MGNQTNGLKIVKQPAKQNMKPLAHLQMIQDYYQQSSMKENQESKSQIFSKARATLSRLGYLSRDSTKSANNALCQALTNNQR